MKKWLSLLVCALSFSAQAAHIEVSASENTIAVGESTTISVLASFSDEEWLGAFSASMWFDTFGLMVDEASVSSSLPNDDLNAFDYMVEDYGIDFAFFSGEGLSGAYNLITFDLMAMEEGVFYVDFINMFFEDVFEETLSFDESSIMSTTLNVTAVDAPAPLTAGLMLMAGLMFVARRKA